MTPDLRRLLRLCIVLLITATAVCAVNLAADNDWAALVVAVALCAVILLVYAGLDAIDRTEAADDYEAVHVLESYRPLGLADEWGYNDEDGAA